MKLAASMSPSEYIQRLPLEGMAPTNDGYLVGISGEVVVGSLSSGSSTISAMDGWKVMSRWTRRFYRGGSKLDMWNPGSSSRRRQAPRKGVRLADDRKYRTRRFGGGADWTDWCEAKPYMM